MAKQDTCFVVFIVQKGKWLQSLNIAQEKKSTRVVTRIVLSKNMAPGMRTSRILAHVSISTAEGGKRRSWGQR